MGRGVGPPGNGGSGGPGSLPVGPHSRASLRRLSRGGAHAPWAGRGGAWGGRARAGGLWDLRVRWPARRGGEAGVRRAGRGGGGGGGGGVLNSGARRQCLRTSPC